MLVLAIVAHPDDESLFAGATLARHVNDGDLVRVVALSDGVGSRYRWWQAQARRSAARWRALDFERACALLGASGWIQPAFHDQQADARCQLLLNRVVERILADRRPALVYTHHVGDLNLDHRCVAEAVLVATRSGPAVRCMTPEYPSRCVGPMFAPNLTIPTDEFLWSKLRACGCYIDELRAYPHPRSAAVIQEQRQESFVEIR